MGLFIRQLADSWSLKRESPLFKTGWWPRHQASFLLQPYVCKQPMAAKRKPASFQNPVLNSGWKMGLPPPVAGADPFNESPKPINRSAAFGSYTLFFSTSFCKQASNAVKKENRPSMRGTVFLLWVEDGIGVFHIMLNK